MSACCCLQNLPEDGCCLLYSFNKMQLRADCVTDLILGRVGLKVLLGPFHLGDKSPRPVTAAIHCQGKPGVVDQFTVLCYTKRPQQCNKIS